MFQHTTVRALSWSVALALSLSGVAQAQRSGYSRQMNLPEGTVLQAELNDRLSSVDSRPGDRFTANLRSDRDGSGLPSGTRVEGQVTSVRRASDKAPGLVDVDFHTLRTPDGRTYPITASLTSLESSSVQRTASGRLEARGRSSKSNSKFIGYGAGAGALIGILSGGDLLTSAILGAGAGYLYNQLNKDKANNGRYSDVNLKEGTEFGVRLDRTLAASIPYDRNSAYASRDTRYGDRYPATDDRRPGAYNRNRVSDIRILVNDRDVRFGEDRPFMSANRVMVPLAAVLESAGYRYNYDSRDREVSINGSRGDTRLTVGDNYAMVDGRRVRLDAPAQRIDGVIFVPVQFLEDAMDFRSEWDADERTLRLTTRTRASLPYDFRVR